MRRNLFLISVYILILGNLAQGRDVKDPTILGIVDGLKRNIALSNGYGAYQHIITTRLTDEGTAKRIEEKYLKTVWISERPKNVLLRVNCKDFDGPLQNSSQCVEFTRAAMTKTPKPDRMESEIKKVRWAEMYKNFDFQMLPPEGSYSVLSFHPKKDGVSSANKVEKILSQMAGKVWVDKEYNIVKAEARLVSPVSFGLGVAAKVNQIGIQYKQQRYQDIQLPSYLSLEFKAKIALFHTEHQRIEVHWSDPYKRADGEFAQAQSPAIVEASDKR